MSRRCVYPESCCAKGVQITLYPGKNAEFSEITRRIRILFANNLKAVHFCLSR